MSQQACVAIIGASRGIGLELVRQYAAAGWRVHATIRTRQVPGPLAAIAGDVIVHRVDVRDTDPARVLAEALENSALDVLIHNAGIKDHGHSRDEVMQVNASAPIVVAETLLDALARSTNARIVLMSSQLGARHGRHGRLGLYGDSKAALNDAFRVHAPAWEKRGITAIVMHPGWVRTDMGGASAPLSVHDSAQGIRTVVDRLDSSEHGKFLTWLGAEHPW